MTKKLVYIDQNIVGHQLSGSLKLVPEQDLTWVYSNEHFSEIRRSSNASKYLNELERMDAKLLELELDADWKITGVAKLNEHRTPTQHYEAYLDAINDIELDDNLFNPLLAWINGGGDEASLNQLSNKLIEEVSSLTKDFPISDNNFNEQICRIKPDFDSMVEQVKTQGNNINNTRDAFGIGKGAVGHISGNNQIMKIWELIKATNEFDVTCDQFFGFDRTIEEKTSIFQGIVGCCAVFDIIGFQSEKKIRKIDKLPNIQSDAGHIAMGAYCSAILSEDKRLIKRAKAIYQYKGIGTTPILIGRRKKD